MFTIIPAIDLKNGRCVRLRQGLADQATVYAEDPVSVARQWREQGASWLHIVDLDGAFQGRPVHTAVIAKILREVPMAAEVGGGLRTDEDIRAVLAAGAKRAIIGTRALEEPREVKRLVGLFGDGLAAGIDARDGRVQVRGWVETSGRLALDLAADLDSLGVQTLIYTDTARDGMLKGVNAAAMGTLCGVVRCSVIASGGVTTPEDVRALLALGKANLTGAIVGKALYEGKVKLADLLAVRAGAVPGVDVVR